MQERFPGKLPPSISVTGRGIADVSPDKLNLTVAVEVIRDSPKEAQAETAAAMDRVIKALLEAGIDAKDIATVRYRVAPHFEEEGFPGLRRGKQKGYCATNIVLVTIHDLDAAGHLMDLAVKAGATTLELGYDYSVPDETRALARQRAFADAEAKAQHLAELAGVQLAEPLLITEVESPWAISAPTERPDIAAPAMAPTPPPVRPSQLRIELSIEVTYSIKQG